MTDQADFDRDAGRIYDAIVAAIFDSIPDDWDEVVLTMKTHDGSIKHELLNPKKVSDLVTATPSDQVYVETARLLDLFTTQSKGWNKAILRLSWDEATEDWRFQIDYTYEREHRTRALHTDRAYGAVF